MAACYNIIWYWQHRRHQTTTLLHILTDPELLRISHCENHSRYNIVTLQWPHLVKFLYGHTTTPSAHKVLFAEEVIVDTNISHFRLCEHLVEIFSQWCTMFCGWAVCLLQWEMSPVSGCVSHRIILREIQPQHNSIETGKQWIKKILENQFGSVPI